MALNEVQKDGSTLREHFEAVERITGKKPEELEQLTSAPCPTCMWYLWRAFLELNTSRRSTEMGPQSLSYLEIEAWARLTRQPVSAWQVEVLMRLDALYLTKQHKKMAKD